MINLIVLVLAAILVSGLCLIGAKLLIRTLKISDPRSRMRVYQVAMLSIFLIYLIPMVPISVNALSDEEPPREEEGATYLVVVLASMSTEGVHNIDFALLEMEPPEEVSSVTLRMEKESDIEKVLYDNFGDKMNQTWMESERTPDQEPPELGPMKGRFSQWKSPSERHIQRAFENFTQDKDPDEMGMLFKDTIVNSSSIPKVDEDGNSIRAMPLTVPKDESPFKERERPEEFSREMWEQMRKGMDVVFVQMGGDERVVDALSSLPLPGKGEMMIGLGIALLVQGVLLASTLTAMLYWLRSKRKFIMSRIGATPCMDPNVLRKVKEVGMEIGVRPPQVMISRSQAEAFIFGWPPILVVSQDMLEMLSDQELDAVIRHEIIHIKNMDHLIKPLLMSLRILFFYNPMVHVFYRCVVKERELIAEDISGRPMHEQRAFLTALLKVHERRKGAAVSTILMK